VAVRSRGKFGANLAARLEPIGAAARAGTRRRPAASGVIYGGEGSRWISRPICRFQHVGAERHRDRPGRLDSAARTLGGRSTRAVLREPVLVQTTDGARTWTQDQPDLTRPDPGIRPTSTRLPPRPPMERQTRVIYAWPRHRSGAAGLDRHDDGLIQMTTDDGTTCAT